MPKPTRPAISPWLSAVLPSVAETWEFGDQLELDRQRARLQLLRQFLRRADREAAGDLRAGVGVDPFRVLRVVDRRRRDQLVVEHDREVLLGRFLADARQLRFLAAVGDFLGRLLEDALAVAREVEGHVRRARTAAAFVEALARVLDLGPRQHRVVLDHEPAVRFLLGDLAVDAFDRAGAHEHRARLDAHRLDVRGLLELFAEQVLFGFLGSAQHLFVLRFEQVPAAVDAFPDLLGRAALAPRRVRLAQFRRAFLGAQDRLVLGQPELRFTGARAARRGRFFGAPACRLRRSRSAPSRRSTAGRSCRPPVRRAWRR